MNVLFVTYHYLNGVGGGVFATRANINAFAEIADKITVLAPADTEYIPQNIDSKVNIISVHDKRLFFKKVYDYYMRGLIHRYYKIFERVLASSDFDIVVFDASCCSFKLIDIAHKYKKKVITIHHNYQYEYSKDNERIPFLYIYLKWIKIIEREAVMKSDLNLTLTISDKQLLVDNYARGNDLKIQVLGAFEYKNKKYSFFNSFKGKNVFVITGTLCTKQMEKSLRVWLDLYFPILISEIPDAKLIIAGKNPQRYLVDFCQKYKNIELVPSPFDIDKIIQKANFYICPVCMGGGIKLRVMDGLKNGLPILTHSVSARGYEAFQGMCLYSYSDKNSFKVSLRSMIKSNIASNLIIDKYNEVFSFQAGVDRLKAFI